MKENGLLTSIGNQENRKYMKALRCLKLDDEWVNLILEGKKVWEIRTKDTKIRERIGLCNIKTKRVVGYATLTDSVKMSVAELLKHNDKHQANDFLKEYGKNREFLYAWVLKDVEKEPNPKFYAPSRGSWSRAT